MPPHGGALTDSPPTAVVLHEGNLINICDLLGADRFELVDARVTFCQRLAGGVEAQWTGYFGDQLVSDGLRWRISTELPVETTWASVA